MASLFYFLYILQYLSDKCILMPYLSYPESFAMLFFLKLHRETELPSAITG